MSSSSSTAAASGEASHGLSVNHGVDMSSGDGDEEIVGMSLAVTVGSSDGGGGGLEPEILDPAILAMSVEGRTTHRQYQYTRERLLELRDAPLSRRRPDYLDPAHNNSQGLWDPERWHHDWKRSETPSENGPRGDQMPDNHKRRSGDPRERLRKEQDGIVLSPQRRSFNSGCFVPLTQPPPRSGRPDSPLGSKGDQHLGHREISQGARRIGSGRIIARDVSWDYRPDKGDLDGPEYGFGRSGPGSGPGRERKDTERDREDRYERRSFGRDFERDRDKDRHVTRNGRYNDRRRISSDSKDDEPEWFSGGPTSQHDTIELRGFEDPVCEERSSVSSGGGSGGAGGRKKQSPSKKKRSKERAIVRTNNDSVVSGKEESPKGPGARSTPTPHDGPNAQCGPVPHSPIQEEQTQPPGTASEQDDRSDAPTDMSTTSVAEPPPASSVPAPPMDFNLEDFLKMDSIPELLTNGVGNNVGTTAGSRFSRWFNKESSPVQKEDSRRSSLQDDHLVNNIINELTEPTNIVIPGLGESDTYFAPISPAAATGVPGTVAPPPGAKPVTLLEMLQRGKQNPPHQHQQHHAKQPNTADVPPVLKNMDVPGKVLSLEELEARMRQGNDRSHDMSSSSLSGANLNRSKQDEDMTAFKRLLAQVNGGQAIPASNGPISHKSSVQQPMSLLQMLSKSQQEDARAAAAQHHGLLGPPSPGAPGPHVPNDLVLKLHQVQQQQRQQQQAEMLSKLINNGTASGHRQQFAMSQHPSEMPQGMGAPGRELLQRPEAVAILQGLKRGDITPQHLIQQLAANPAMQPRHRELLMTILKQGSGMGPSPRVLSPVPPPQHLLFQQQQQQQQQLRVSPLPPSAMQQRIPSPRELQAHTQGIMQRALIKKKLEEQQENFRKKQEMQQRSLSPAVVSSAASSNASGANGPPVSGSGNTGASPAKHMSSPTPLAFTPTSVLRKMTAEKEGEPPNNSISKDANKNSTSTNETQAKQPQGRAVTGMRQPPVQQSQPLPAQNWNLQQQPGLKQPVGRPIVKGNNNYQYLPQDYQQMQMSQHQRNIFQQQQQQARGKMSVPQNQSQFNMQNRVLQQQQQNQIRNPLQNLQQMHQRGTNWPHSFYETRGIPVTGRGMQLGRGSPNDGELSPTSDQLARWFSPELLAQARAGKLPDMPPASIAQNALSLEELERIQQSTAPVHN